MDTEEIRARVATRIREVAARRKVSLNRLIELSGVSRTQLFAVLRGERAVTVDTLTKLAVALNVDPVELLKPPRGKPKRKPSDAS